MTKSDKPAETTSKKQVSRLRQIIDVDIEKNQDPRFSNLSGTFNKERFNQSYGFIKELQQEEIKTIKQSARVEQDEETKDKLTKLHQALSNRVKTDEGKDKRDEIKREWKKIQAEKIKKGGKAFYLKDSDVKKLQLVEKFKSMKTKEMNSFLEKKRKRNATEEHKFIPRSRNEK